MKQKTEIKAVSLVRRIRDEQASRLAGLANRAAVEVMDSFNRAAQRAEKRASRLRSTSALSKASNRGIQPSRRQKQRRAADA